MRLAFDIESDGLMDTMTVIHSVCIKNLDTGQGWSCTDHEGYVSPLGYEVISVDAGLKMLMEADRLIGHNIIKFDVPAIQLIKPWFKVKREAYVDTLIMSRLIWPEIKTADFQLRAILKRKARVKYSRLQLTYDDEITVRNLAEGETIEFLPEDKWIHEHLKAQFPGQLIGSHGLEAWGYRLGEWKGDYSKEMKAKGLDPWKDWNPAMQEYCEQDVVVTEQLFHKLDAKQYSPAALRTEHDFAVILAEMERNGFPFHMQRATKLQGKLMRRHAELTQQLKEAFPPKIDREEFIPKVNNKTRGYVKGVPFIKEKVVEFNPSSRPHIARWLKDKYKWKPKEYTDTGQPVIDEKVLKKLRFPEAKLLSEYFLLDKRLGMLEGKGGKGLIPFGKSGRIHGQVMTNGAVTRRCTHNKPNMAQLPATNVPFGKDFRELMYAPDGWSLLGWDASGLELRCFAHYMAFYDGGKYIDIVLDGDIHTTHAKALGLIPENEEYDEHNQAHDHGRNKVAKRFIYAYLYGAGDEMIGEIVMPTGSAAQKRAAGKKLKSEFLSRTPALVKLKKQIEVQIKKRNNKLVSIDGGEMHVRSPHSALNTLLQSAGAIVVKVATILFYDKLIAKGLVSGKDFQLVAHVHDEVQTLVRKGLEDIVGETSKEAMVDAGKALGFKCPLAADYKYGASWADTH